MKEKVFSIKHKFLLLIAISIVSIVIVVAGNIIPKAKKIIGNAIQNNMYDIVTLSSALIDAQVEHLGAENVGTPELTEILQGIGIQDVSSSYIYVVDMDKIFVYHPKEEKIGTEVFNSTVSNLIDDVKSGAAYEKQKAFTYIDENGVGKYAAYSVSTISNYVVVIVGNEKDALAKLNAMANGSLLVILGVAAILLVFSYFVASSIVKPILAMTKTIESTAELDFSDNGTLITLSKHNDETGQMARAIGNMQTGLRDIVGKLQTISTEMFSNAENLTDITTKINSASTDNSATSEELAASMEETSATASVIDSNMSQILVNTDNINKKALDGVELAKNISKRANDMNESTTTAYQATKDMYASVKVKTYEALEKSKAVKKVNELASGIQEIADQTSLLSLNASIEAARAGENGKGFAVVAGEIGALANQSTHTVNEIMSIIQEVNGAVDNMEECMSTTLAYIENQILHDYEMFESISKQYDSDADTVDESMNSIFQMAEILKETATDIVSAVSGITETIAQAAFGVEDVAEKTTNVVELSTDVVGVVENTSNNSQKLEQIAKSFTL